METKKICGMDIIIPVYNALDDLKKCLNTIYQNTDLSVHHVYLIDDKSPDENVWPFLQSINRGGVTVWQNEKNKGFSGTVNRGIQNTERDVILLNTDTLVTRGWVEKIYACMHSEPLIGTVTPLCNNATICSIPEYCQENTLPEGYTLEEYADLVERSSMKQYPDLCVAVGFCMGIKRELIHKIGLFDAETFERGYGEENDFCLRAEQMGYRNVLCDDTYIYHTGSVSFGSQARADLAHAHELILIDRYPKQMEACAAYCAANPLKPIQENVKLHMRAENGRKNILFLAQRDFREDAFDHIGGTQFHVKDLTMELRSEYNVFVLARDREYLQLTIYGQDTQDTLRFYIGPAHTYNKIHDEAQRRVYEAVLDGFHIDIVHIQNTYQLSLDLYFEAKKRGLVLFCTLHDCYYLCPCLQMLDANDELCLGRQTEQGCAKCMSQRRKIAAQVPYRKNWIEDHEKALSLCDCIFVPSESARQIVLETYPQIADRLTVIPHGIDLSIFHKVDVRSREQAAGLNVAFIGGISPAKGSKLVTAMIKNGSKDIQWTIIGGVGDNELFLMERKNLNKTNWYVREELADKLQEYQIDVVCLLSVCSETFCYTLSEVTACGVPCLALDVGAIGERMKKMGIGWLVPADSTPEAILKKLDELKNDPEQVRQMAQKAKMYKVRDRSEMAADYRKNYQKFSNATATYQLADQSFIYQAFCMGSQAENVQSVANEQDAQLYERLQRAENRLAAIEGSASFKAMIWVKEKLGHRTKVLKKLAKKIAAIFHLKVM